MSTAHFIPPQSRRGLNGFFNHIYEEFEFYRNRFAAEAIEPNDSIEQILDKLPQMNSSDLPLLGSDALHRIASGHFLTDLSSGTTGQTKCRYSTRNDELAEAKICGQFFEQCGIASEDRVLALDIDSADIYAFYGQVLADINVTHYTFASVPPNHNDAVTEALRERPTIIMITPSLLRRILPLLISMRRRGKSAQLRKVIYLGEGMSEEFRKKVEETLEVEIFSFYGSTEIGSVAGECQAHNGLHIFSHGAVLSLHNTATFHRDVASGEALWTTPHMKDYPLVKYATRDFVTVTDKPCLCGMSEPRIQHIRRSQEQFVLYGQKFPYRTFIEVLEREKLYPDFVQVVVDEKDDHTELTIRVPNMLKSKESSFHLALRNFDDLQYFMQMGFLSYNVSFVELPVMIGRKAPLFIDNREL